MSPKILNLLLDFSLGAILKKFLIFAHFQPPIFIKIIVRKTNGVYLVFSLTYLSFCPYYCYATIVINRKKILGTSAVLLKLYGILCE